MTRTFRKPLVGACLATLCSLSAFAVEFGEGHWVDLTHELTNDIPEFPMSQPFVHTPGFVGINRDGVFMATNNYSSSEHIGTHLDAPIHFHEAGKSIEQLGVDRVMGNAIVIDVKGKVADDPNYLIAVVDILDWEKAHGQIPDDSIVLFNTGLSNVWPDAGKYLGTDKRGIEGVAELQHAAIHRDTAVFLTENREIKSIGIDSVSFDNSLQEKSDAHRIFFQNDIPGVENIANLDLLPPKGAYIIGLPMKIKNGSAAPIRIIAFIPADDSTK